MKTVFHAANSRGLANHGWLQSRHTFSFAGYSDPERMNFGLLRVLNDDRVAAGQGFGRHPHNNMEIISIPLEGDLEHADSMGNKKVIQEGDIQIMSAGTGVFHSEYNKNTDREVKFLQIWIFPKEKNITPRYDQIPIRTLKVDNQFYQILSPNADDQGVQINQDAWFHMGEFEAGASATYKIKQAGNGVYAFVLEGELNLGTQQLSTKDGLGIYDTDEFEVTATSKAKVLLMEIPMN